MTAFFGGGIPLAAQAIAVVEVAMAGVLLAGMLVVRKGRVRLHMYLQGSVVLLNLPIVFAWMVPRYWTGVLPGLPAELSGTYYLFPSVMLGLGAAAEALGVYIVLVAATRWIPERFRFRRYKLWMRTELVLWWTVVLLGLGVYLTWYVYPSAGS